MSSYRKQTKHPNTGEWENALWIDDLFGHHHYGVVFPSDQEKNPDLLPPRIAYDPQRLDLETKDV
jgi:hypothetical protein